MRQADPRLIDMLQENSCFFVADLYTLTLLDGSAYRWTSADVDITVAGQVFSHLGPILSRTYTRLTVGVEVDTMTVTIAAGDRPDTHPPVVVAGSPIIQAVRLGKLDGARMRVEKLIAPDWADTSRGTLLMFDGRISNVDISRTQAKLYVRSDLELLNLMLPVNLYQAGCARTLYDAGCGVKRESFEAKGTVTVGGTSALQAALTDAALKPASFADGYFELGTVNFISGPNEGLTRTVKTFNDGVITLSYPLPSPCGAGDAFLAYPGCDKLQKTCQTKFANLDNFRGFPFVPTPETTL